MRRHFAIAAALSAAIFFSLCAQAEKPAKPGLPALQQPFAELHPAALLKLGETADWVDIAGDAVWVGAGHPYSVHAIDPATQREIAAVALPGEACAGLASGYGSLWVALCGEGAARGLAQIDLASHQLIRVLPFGPEAEGGIAVGGGSVWMVQGKRTLLRIDPADGHIRQKISLPTGSYNPIAAGPTLWVTNYTGNRIAMVALQSGKLERLVPTGPAPRFLTAGGGAIWTLNQGDGSVSHLDQKTGRLLATIPLGLPGPGGDIAFGDGKVWVTMDGVPLTAIDPATNQPLRQWVGPGGDSLKVDAGWIWLTDYHGGTVAAIADPFR